MNDISSINQKPLQLFLVRHGNTFEAGQEAVQVGLRTDLPLTEKGREQAASMGLFLNKAGIEPALIAAGSLKRQSEAAQIMAKLCCAEDKVSLGVPALDEVDFGAWEGFSASEIEKRWPRENADWNEAGIWPEHIFGGSLAERLEKIENWIKLLRRTYRQDQSVVAVTSNGNIRFFCWFMKGYFQELARKRKMKDLKVKTGNYCELEVLNDSLRIVSWNCLPSSALEK